MASTPRFAVARRLAPLVGVAVGAAGIVFVVRTLVVRADEVADAFSSMNPTALLASIGLGIAAMWTIGRNWVSMLTTRGHPAPMRRAMAWYFTGQLGKYVPGGIWPIVGRAELAVRGGVPRSAAYGATTASMAATYAAAALVSGVGSIVAWSYPWVGLALVVLLALVALVTGSPAVRSRTTRLASRAGVPLTDVPTARSLSASVVAHTPAWLLVAASTWITTKAFGANLGLADVAFASSASWLAGFVVVGVPGGIGVREAVFTALAAPAIGSSVAVSVAVASRVVFVVGDVVAALAAGAVASASARRMPPAERGSAEV